MKDGVKIKKKRKKKMSEKTFEVKEKDIRNTLEENPELKNALGKLFPEFDLFTPFSLRIDKKEEAIVLWLLLSQCEHDIQKFLVKYIDPKKLKPFEYMTSNLWHLMNIGFDMPEEYKNSKTYFLKKKSFKELHDEAITHHDYWLEHLSLAILDEFCKIKELKSNYDILQNIVDKVKNKVSKMAEKELEKLYGSKSAREQQRKKAIS